MGKLRGPLLLIVLALGTVGCPGGATAPVRSDRLALFQPSDDSGLGEVCRGNSCEAGVVDAVESVEAMQEILGRGSSPQSCADPQTLDFLNDQFAGSAGSGGDLSYKSGAGTVSSRGRSEPQAAWDECSGNLRAAYADDPSSPARCTTRKLSVDLAKKLDLHMMSCIREAAARELQLPKGMPATAWTGHMGVSPDSNHSSRSLHSLGRAIDLNLIKFRHDGKDYSFSYLDASKAYRASVRGTKASASDESTYRFFKSVETCWNRLSPPPGASVNCGSPNHDDHVHLSVPLRPNPGFYEK